MEADGKHQAHRHAHRERERGGAERAWPWQGREMPDPSTRGGIASKEQPAAAAAGWAGPGVATVITNARALQANSNLNKKKPKRHSFDALSDPPLSFLKLVQHRPQHRPLLASCPGSDCARSIGPNPAGATFQASRQPSHQRLCLQKYVAFVARLFSLAQQRPVSFDAS